MARMDLRIEGIDAGFHVRRVSGIHRGNMAPGKRLTAIVAGL
jgi:hypothetical protein